MKKFITKKKIIYQVYLLFAKHDAYFVEVKVHNLLTNKKSNNNEKLFNNT